MMKKHIIGSILIEIAIGISVMGVIAGLTMSHFSSQRKLNRHKVTKDNIEATTMAIAAFLAKNNRLPKPANDYNGNEGDENGKYVPYKALNIQPRMAMDGNGNNLIYVAERDLTQDFNCIYFDSNMPYSQAFCEKQIIKTLVIENANDIEIAFAIDVPNGGISFQKDKAYIRQREYTTWISRDMLLMKYLKNPPCNRINYRENNNPPSNSDSFLF